EPTRRVPEELATALASGQCVLCIGAGVSLGTNGVPSGRELAQDLAKSVGYIDENLTLPHVAQYYEMVAGRHALTSFLVGKISDSRLTPQLSHKLIATLPLATVITTNFDTLMEQQWERAGVAFNRVIRNEDLTYAQAGRTTYIKMHGSIDMPDTLVV